MKHNKKRVSKIVDELIVYLFSIGASNINVNILEEKDFYKIRISSNYRDKDMEKIDNLKKYLSCEKQEEMEEYYWELTGECDIDTELTLVGMMTDKCEININDDKIELELFKYK